MRIVDCIVQAKEREVLIAIQAEWQKDDKFLCGYVEEIDGEDFKLRYVNLHGEPGRSDAECGWIGFGEVNWIETKSPYLCALEKLYRAWAQFEGMKPARWKKSPAGIKRALKDCLASGEYCSIRYSDNDGYAKVESVDRYIAKLTVFWSDYSYMGSVFIRPDQIKAIRTGGIDEKQAEFLLRR